MPKDKEGAVSRKRSRERVQNGRQWGSTYERARRWARILNGLGWASAAWVVFYPRPVVLAAGVAMAMPIIAVLALRWFPGVMKFEANKGSREPAVMIAFLIPLLGLDLAALNAFEILEWHGFWAPFAVISAGLFALTLFCAEDVRARASVMVPVLLFCCAYGYGVTLTLNGSFDTSVATVYEPQVMAKRISSGKRRSYYLKLSPWGSRVSKEVSVPQSFYQERNVGDRVRVMVKEGWLKIPWFYVR